MPCVTCMPVEWLIACRLRRRSHSASTACPRPSSLPACAAFLSSHPSAAPSAHPVGTPRRLTPSAHPDDDSMDAPGCRHAPMATRCFGWLTRARPNLQRSEDALDVTHPPALSSLASIPTLFLPYASSSMRSLMLQCCTAQQQRAAQHAATCCNMVLHAATVHGSASPVRGMAACRARR